jgi:hypothetical protein
VPVASFIGFRRAFEPFDRILTNSLEHAETPGPVGYEALVEQGLECRQVGVADVLGRFEREAADEDGEAVEQLPLHLVEQIVTPVDRRAERLLALLHASHLREEVEPL